MSKKSQQQLLKEELKRFKQLNEYTFYVPEDYDEYDDTKDLILGEEGDEDTDLDPADLEATPEGGEDMGAEGGDDISDLEGGEESIDDIGMEDTPAEDEVELDVTDLVQGSEEAKQSADMANQKIDQVLRYLDNLESKLNTMDAITAKIEDLENEVEKRMPTEEEKLEMRSLDSYPYNLKLTDYWAEKGGQYNVMGDDYEEEEAEPKEYVLTQDDIDSDYNFISVRNSLKYDNEYEEEDI